MISLEWPNQDSLMFAYFELVGISMSRRVRPKYRDIVCTMSDVGGAMILGLCKYHGERYIHIYNICYNMDTTVL